MPNTSLPGPVPETIKPILVPAGTPSLRANGKGCALTSLALASCWLPDDAAVVAELSLALSFLSLFEQAPITPAASRNAIPTAVVRVIAVLRLMVVIGFAPSADRRHAVEEHGRVVRSRRGGNKGWIFVGPL